MKFVIAPDKYKDALSGVEFCEAVEEGIKHVFPNAEIVKIPLADGGDGTIDVIKEGLSAEVITIQVNDPLFRKIDARYLYVPQTRTAYIEMAEASGLRLLREDERNCLHTTTFGTGELIKDALDKKIKTLYLGIGGSATNDAGIGMATALGFKFLDINLKEINPSGKNLSRIEHINDIKAHPTLKDISVKVACDVNNPLYGQNGAALVYGNQKGANKDGIELLDRGLKHFANKVKECFDLNISSIPGSGAAGGLGAGAIVFLNGKLVSGIDMIKEITDFDRQIENADWIITGEGKLDSQTFSGKTVLGVLQAAKTKNVPVAAFCGSVDLSIKDQKELGLRFVCAISPKISDLETAISNSYDNLVKTSYNFAQLLKSK